MRVAGRGFHLGGRVHDHSRGIRRVDRRFRPWTGCYSVPRGRARKGPSSKLERPNKSAVSEEKSGGSWSSYRSRDQTAWAQSKGEVLGVLDRFVGEFEDIRDDVIAILSTITGDRAERGKGTSA